MNQNSVNTTNRIAYVDLGAGVMIIWLLYYHALYPMYEREILNVFPWLFYFMPWFFYKSGYFYKPKSLKENARKDAQKLLKQFAIWSAIGYAVYIICRFFLFNDLSLRMLFYTPLRSLILGGSIPLNNALWFLLTLFLVRQIATILFPKYSTILLCVLSAIVACVFHFVNCRFIPFTLYSTAWGLCFFCAGYYIRRYEQELWVIIISVFVLLLTFAFTDIPEVYKKEDTIEWYWYILWYPSSMAGCIVFNNICRWLSLLTGTAEWGRAVCNIPIFSWVGRHSMTFYVSHFIIFKVVYDIIGHYKSDWYSGWQGLLIITIAYSIIIIPLCFITERIQEKRIKI